MCGLSRGFSRAFVTCAGAFWGTYLQECGWIKQIYPRSGSCSSQGSINERRSEMKSKTTSHQTAFPLLAHLQQHRGENVQQEQASGVKRVFAHVASSPFSEWSAMVRSAAIPKSWSNCGQRLCPDPNRGKQSSAVAWKRHRRAEWRVDRDPVRPLHRPWTADTFLVITAGRSANTRLSGDTIVASDDAKWENDVCKEVRARRWFCMSIFWVFLVSCLNSKLLESCLTLVANLQFSCKWWLTCLHAYPKTK